MGYEEFSAAMTNRSLRTIKAELEFLSDSGTINPEQLTTILANLPPQPASISSLQNLPAAPVSDLPSLPIRNGNAADHTPAPSSTIASPPPSHNEKIGYYASNPSPPPPAYPSAPPAAGPLATATALYAYNPTDAGDLQLHPHDRVHVTEYMNAEWWKGRSERTGMEGIFPRSYVRVDEDNKTTTPAQQSMSYGNMPMAVAGQGEAVPPAQQQQGAAQQQGGKGGEMGKKFGKKLGNAAIFGAGATIGGNIVNGIF
ncbi:SH3-domain-containing protein [Saccharata proteae CBS 121410]|uniref:SH3-domain-containing protein n=1 Tax=Saccharata proteae CBS 121410 TaxID=1314787 RepID=A0A9P4I3F9_9PEZI|nr:SH3-domain-containing protein [Saccharata proteae CBS 121410]